jgi:hypothetical protein
VNNVQVLLGAEEEKEKGKNNKVSSKTVCFIVIHHQRSEEDEKCPQWLPVFNIERKVQEHTAGHGV